MTSHVMTESIKNVRVFMVYAPPEEAAAGVCVLHVVDTRREIEKLQQQLE